MWPARPGSVQEWFLRSVKLAASLSVKRGVLVTDASMEEHGYAERVEKYLHQAGIECCVFAGVEPEPSVETTDAVAELAREHECQLVVGLGGGSCLDVAKAVSVLITNEGSAAAYQGLGLVKKPGVPKILVPTTAGTGSEVTFTSVLIRKSDGVKGGHQRRRSLRGILSSGSGAYPFASSLPDRRYGDGCPYPCPGSLHQQAGHALQRHVRRGGLAPDRPEYSGGHL